MRNEDAVGEKVIIITNTHDICLNAKWDTIATSFSSLLTLLLKQLVTVVRLDKYNDTISLLMGHICKKGFDHACTLYSELYDISTMQAVNDLK